MNKLYKYLPFDITLEGTGKGYSNNILPKTGILKGIHRLGTEAQYHVNKEIVQLLGYFENETKLKSFSYEIQDVKPVLRPFEDLTKELPLTRTAAEILKKQEGEVVKPIMEFFRVVTNDRELPERNYSYQVIAENNIIIHRYENIVHQTIDLYNDWNFVRWGLWKVTYSKQAFDFLRAMKFAVDFSEDEYIKLED